MKISKLTFLFLISFICSLQFCFGQVIFQKTIDSPTIAITYDGQQTTDGGYILIGDIQNQVLGGNDIILIKINTVGDTIWTKKFRFTFENHGKSVFQTIDGGYIFLGSNLSGVFTVKTDTAGNIIWSKNYSNASFIGETVVQNANGTYFICANTNNTLGVFGIDALGDTLWTKFQAGNVFATVTSSQAIGNNEIIVTGFFRNIPNPLSECFLMKADASGNIVWNKSYTNTGYNNSFSVKKTYDNGFVIAGVSNSGSPTGDYDIFVIKTDSSGNVLWSKKYGDIGNEEAFSIEQANDSGFVIAGSKFNNGATYSDLFLLKTDVNGSLQWIKSYGGSLSEVAEIVVKTSDGGYFMAGSTSSFATGFLDSYLIKTDSLGNSGCNESNTTMIVDTFLTVTGTAFQFAPWLNFTVNNTIPIISSGVNSTTLCSSVGINEYGASTTPTLSPNPTSGNFTITFPSTINKGTITVTNNMGAKLYSQNIVNANTASIQLNNFAKGIYFVKMSDGEKQIAKKIILK